MSNKGPWFAARTIQMVAAAAIVAGAGVMSGCSTPNDGQGPKGLLDPTAVGRYNVEPLVVPILENLDIIPEDTQEEFANAEAPRQSDLEIVREDYRIGRNDLISAAITGLLDQFQETVVTKRVSESGNVSMPLVGPVNVLDLTEAEAEQAIAQAYRDSNIIQNANVSVTVIEARARTFSILGAVGAPGQYAIVSSDFRVLDALVLARDITAPVGVDNIYIIRRVEDDIDGQQETQPQQQEDVQPSPELIQPQSKAEPASPLAKVVYLQAEGEVTETEEGVVIIEGEERTVGPAAQPQANGIQVDQDEIAEPVVGGEFDGFNDLRDPVEKRIIRIPVDALKRGDLRYNVVIRPNDMILVPQPAVGEYYMGGNVLRPGVYSLTGRNITLKQAIISAGMFNALAVPSRTEVIRRLPGNREVYARVDLDKIFAGEQPDLYLKPNDVVNVGTNAAAPFMAALRGAFRFTYGFGFLYDRNYYDRAYRD